MLSGCVLGVGLQRRSIRRGYKSDCNLHVVLVQGLVKNERSPLLEGRGLLMFLVICCVLYRVALLFVVWYFRQEKHFVLLLRRQFLLLR